MTGGKKVTGKRKIYSEFFLRFSFYDFFPCPTFHAVFPKLFRRTFPPGFFPRASSPRKMRKTIIISEKWAGTVSFFPSPHISSRFFCRWKGSVTWKCRKGNGGTGAIFLPKKGQTVSEKADIYGGHAFGLKDGYFMFPTARRRFTGSVT